MTTPEPTPVARKKRLRLREVEELYLGGYCAKEIHDLIGERHAVTYGTIRNDICSIRKIWTDDVDKQDKFRGRQRYLAALKQVRRKVMGGWKESDGLRGHQKIRGRDYRLAHELDKEIATLSGVELSGSVRTVHLNVEVARDFMKAVMGVVFRYVTDAETRENIVNDLRKLDDESR